VLPGRFGLDDLPAGGVAVVALLLLDYVFGLTLWLAGPLAFAVYVGLVLVWLPRLGLRPVATADKAGPEERARQAALANVAAIRALEPRIAKPVVRDRVGHLVNRSDRILALMGENGARAAAPLFNERLLAPSTALLTEYVCLAEWGLTSAGGLLARFETRDLPKIELAIDTVYEQLNRALLVDLTALGEVLDSSLKGLESRTPGQPPGETTPPSNMSPGVPGTGVSEAPAAATWLATRHGLSRREIETFGLLAQRLSNREIAERLCIAEKTAEHHTARILGKLDVKSRREVAALAARHGFPPPSTSPNGSG
jgi:DNA-binding CsgD family transcriptional regulator